MSEYIPEDCVCQDTDVGASTTCTIDAGGYDTINIEFDLNLCEEELSVDLKLQDDLTSFEYMINEGDEGVIPTGLFLGLPGVGSADIYLTYMLSGNIDSLKMSFGFDLGVTIPIYGTTMCSDEYPDKCPLVFLDTEVDFGEVC